MAENASFDFDVLINKIRPAALAVGDDKKNKKAQLTLTNPRDSK